MDGTEYRLMLPTPEYRTRRWRVVLEPSRGLWGYCDHDDRKIQIDPTMSALEQVATLFHEVNHAVAGDHEEHVTQTERAMMSALRLVHRIHGDLGEHLTEFRNGET